MSNRSTRRYLLAAIVMGIFSVVRALPADAQIDDQKPVPVIVQKTDNGWQLLREEKPFYIRGAGGTGSLALLAAAGGNSNRIWGVDENTQAWLDEAHRNGIAVAVGIWLEHERKGFDYENQQHLDRQTELVLSAVRKFKNHPAVLLWGIGNEMEGYQSGDNPAIWKHVQHLCQLIKKEDPHHPTMSVIAEIGGNRVPAIHKLCPSLDIIGINSYGGATSLPARYRKAGGTKPYIVTEFGPAGTWEVAKDEIGAVVEKTSTQKAAEYRATYEKLSDDKELCLGSYAFLWGHKQEATATWFGMLLADGRRTASVDTMSQLWTGTKPANLCPTIQSLECGSKLVDAGQVLHARLSASDPENDSLDVKWELMQEVENYLTAGDYQGAPPSFPTAIIKSDDQHAEVRVPESAGVYRLYVYVSDPHGGAATANFAFRVKAGQLSDPGVLASIPFMVYDEPGDSPGFVPSGFMGETAAISIDPQCTDKPKSGEHCMKCEFDKSDGWGGVVWQHPESDWGEKPGGFDLSQAKKLSFWARGTKGGEKIKFGVGLLGRDKKFFDTTQKEMAVSLGTDWMEFSFDLTHADLRRIKSGFYWSLASQGTPVTFYLDRIVFEK